MFNIINLSFYTFSVVLILNILIMNNCFGIKFKNLFLKLISLNFFTLLLVIYLFFLMISLPFTFLDISLINWESNTGFEYFDDLISYMSDKNNTGKGNSNNLNINMTNPRLNVSVPTQALNNAWAVASATGGVYPALRVAQAIPGNPAVKAGAFIGTYTGIQATTAGMKKVFDYIDNPVNPAKPGSSSKTNSIISDTNFKITENNLPDNNIDFNTSVSDLNNTSDDLITSNLDFNEYPLNLIPELNQLATAELILMVVLFNLIVSRYLTTVNYTKYIPDNKFGNLLNKWLERYITVWTKSFKFIFTFCFIALYSFLLVSKIFLYFILNT